MKITIREPYDNWHDENLPDYTLHDYNVDPSMDIESLKEMVYKTTGTPVNQQRLIYNTIPLADKKTLAHYGMDEGALIYLVLCLKGC